MAFSKALAERVRSVIVSRKGFSEKKMFGGVGFLLHGNMCVGVWKEFLIVRLGPEDGEASLGEPFVRPFDITGRAMKGWAMIEPEGTDSDADLRAWIERAVMFVVTLPPK